MTKRRPRWARCLDGPRLPTADLGRGPHAWPLLTFLSVLMGFASISTDLYLPAMPAMGRALGAGAGQIEWTVSAFLAGFTGGQLLWGPIGDRHGRRAPIAAGLVLFTLGSAGCALAGGIHALIAARLVQAVGASASVALGRAMVRDLHDGPAAARMMSNLMTAMAVAPLLGPFAGAQVLASAGWRAIFWLLTAVGLATLVALPALPETLPPAQRENGPLTIALHDYWTSLRDRRLLAYAGVGGFFYAGMFAYIAGSPHAYIVLHHVSPRAYGLLFATGVVGIMGANLLNARSVHRIGGDQLLVAGAACAAGSGVVLAAITCTGGGGLVGLAAPLFLYASAAGFVVANALVGALALSPIRAGSVSALVGAIQYGAGIAGSAAIGAVADGTARPMAFVIAASGTGTLVCAMIAVRSRSLDAVV